MFDDDDNDEHLVGHHWCNILRICQKLTEGEGRWQFKIAHSTMGLKFSDPTLGFGL